MLDEKIQYNIMQKRKVLFIIESLIVGGAEKVLIDIANNLNPADYDVAVCSVFKHSVYTGYNNTFDNPFAKHVKYKSLINNNIGWLYRLSNALLNRCPNLLYKLLLRERYDCVVAFYEGLPTYLLANVQLKGTRKIAWLHTTTELSQAGRTESEIKQQDCCYDAFDKIVAISKGVAESFCKCFPRQKEKVVVAYNPIPDDVVRKKAEEQIDMPRHDEHPLFVSVGRMTPAKGFDRWLRVVAALFAKGYRFYVWIVGGGDSKELQNYIDAQKLGEWVHLLGHQSNPYPFVREADWIISSSRVEGLSIALTEALIVGKAICATNCPGQQELFEGYDCAVIVDNDEQALETGIVNILNNPELKNYYEKRAAERGKDFKLANAMSVIESILRDA